MNGHSPSRFRSANLISGLMFVALVATGCASSTPASPGSSGLTPPASQTASVSAGSPSAAPRASQTASASELPVAGLHLVVVGDSIPFGGYFCPSCTGFVDEYAKILQKRSGQQVNVANRSRDDSAGVDSIRDQLTSDASLRAELMQADVVVLSVGFNNALPDYGNPPPGGFPPGCDTKAPGIDDEIIAHIVATTPQCNTATAAAWTKDYDAIFTAMAGLRTGKPTVFIALNVYDGNLDNSDIRAAMDAKTFAATEKVIVDAYDKWNAMLCKQAAAHGFACIDVYHAFDGPQGTRPAGDLTVDGAHPSQEGNDLIAALLAKVDVSAVTR